MKFSNPEETSVAISTTDVQLTRWLFGLERLGVAVDYVNAAGGSAMSPERVATLRKVMESVLGTVNTAESSGEPAPLTLEVGSEQRRVFDRIGSVAAAELRDSEKVGVHPGLMHGLFGGRTTFPLYTSQAAEMWLGETYEIAYGDPEPFTASPV